MQNTFVGCTETELTELVDEIMQLCNGYNIKELEEELKNYQQIVGEPAARVFVLYTTAVIRYKCKGGLYRPAAKDVVAGVKAWYLDNKRPCFRNEVQGPPVKLSRQELTDLVSKMLGDGPITREDINLYYRAVNHFAAPDFLDVPKGTPVEKVVNHICQWHAIYNGATFS